MLVCLVVCFETAKSHVINPWRVLLVHQFLTSLTTLLAKPMSELDRASLSFDIIPRFD